MVLAIKTSSGDGPIGRLYCDTPMVEFLTKLCSSDLD